MQIYELAHFAMQLRSRGYSVGVGESNDGLPWLTVCNPRSLELPHVSGRRSGSYHFEREGGVWRLVRGLPSRLLKAPKPVQAWKRRTRLGLSS